MSKIGRKVQCVHNKYICCDSPFGAFQKCFTVVFLHEASGKVSGFDLYFCRFVPEEQKVKIREAMKEAVSCFNCGEKVA
jgi:hypothetical protein